MDFRGTSGPVCHKKHHYFDIRSGCSGHHILSSEFLKGKTPQELLGDTCFFTFMVQLTWNLSGCTIYLLLIVLILFISRRVWTCPLFSHLQGWAQEISLCLLLFGLLKYRLFWATSFSAMWPSTLSTLMALHWTCSSLSMTFTVVESPGQITVLEMWSLKHITKRNNKFPCFAGYSSANKAQHVLGVTLPLSKSAALSFHEKNHNAQSSFLVRKWYNRWNDHKGGDSLHEQEVSNILCEKSI